MNFDCVSFIDWFMKIIFGFGCAVGLSFGVIIGIFLEWRIVRKILKESE